MTLHIREFILPLYLREWPFTWESETLPGTMPMYLRGNLCTWEIAYEGHPVYLRICSVPGRVFLFLRKCPCRENGHVCVPERYPFTWEIAATVPVRMTLQELWHLGTLTIRNFVFRILTLEFYTEFLYPGKYPCAWKTPCLRKCPWKYPLYLRKFPCTWENAPVPARCS